MTDSYDINVFNGLIETTIDSADGYRRAGSDSHSSQLRQMFMERAQERDGIVAELQAHVRQLGGTPETKGSMLAGAHRWFIDMKDALMGGDDKAVINEVERGEDYIKEKFDKARNDADLSAQSAAVIDRCYSSVRAGHDQMRDLKHGYADQRS